MNNTWMLLVGFFIGLLCHLSITVPSKSESYLEGYKKGLNDGSNNLLDALKKIEEEAE